MTTGLKQFEVIAVRCTPNELTVTWQNARQKTRVTAYSSIWLRDNSPINRDTRTGQRLISVTELPLQLLLKAAKVQGTGDIRVSWEDGESCVFPGTFFGEFERDRRISSRPMQLPWVKQPATNFAWCPYADWVEDRNVRAHWLRSVARDGMAFLSDVPIQEGSVLGVADQLGFVRETNYGRVFDVRSVVQPNNLAYTSLGLRVHTDNPYREPVPGFQLLHCLAVAGQGGESLFVDGLAVVERLRKHHPDSFAVLSKTPIRFRFQDAEVDLAADRTMIEADEQEQFRAIYYNDRSIAPLTLRAPLLAKYYAAYRQLAAFLDDPARCVTYRLQPGDLVLFDNTRILHGRTAFSIGEGGECGVRHLQGCYVDADGIYSSLAVLSRKKEHAA